MYTCTKINEVISIYFKINLQKSLGKASSFTKIYGIFKDFPDLTLHLKNISAMHLILAKGYGTQNR